MKLPHVFARATATVHDLGHPHVIRLGAHYLADDPVVVARPDLFTEDPRYGLSFSGEPPAVLRIPPEDEAPSAPQRPRAPAARR